MAVGRPLPEASPDGTGDTRGKVMSLTEAVRRFIAPGASLHLAYGGGRPNATVAEIVRQFRGSRPGFTVSAQGFVNTQHALVAAGLVERLVVAFAGENYPGPRPNPVLQRALRRGELEIESWSLWTLTARLIAGALGTGFAPVRSLAGSSIGADLAGRDYTRVEAFGAEVDVVRELRPDVTLVHGLVGDEEGNVVLPPPFGERAWGAMAASSAVIATVERIVGRAEIQRHNTMPVVPGHVVSAVCEAPLGAHPYGLDGGGVSGVAGYAEDDDFMADLRRAAKDDDAIQAWIDDWIVATGDHAGLLDRLGPERLERLRTPPATTAPAGDAPPNESERMTLALVRVLRERILAAGHQLVLAGIGYAHLAAWTAVTGLQRAGHRVELAAELGISGVRPLPGDPYLFALQNLPTSVQLTDVMDVLGRDVGGPATSSLGVLGAGVLDQEGNINSTWSSGTYVVGSGGANDVATAADEVVVVVKHARDRLVEHVEYVTAPGAQVSLVVTSEAILERRDGVLTAIRYLGDGDPAAAARDLREHTGWELVIAPDLRREPDPDPDDLRLLRSFDPRRVFLR
jgi:acyl CoA:acetate/3-ketoacid CoA transferase alpha subunit